MNAISNINLLLQAIRRYRLDQRSDEVRQWLALIERGLMSEPMAKAMLYQLEPLKNEQERRRNLLHRAPMYEEFYPNDHPHLIVGKLAERPDVPLGLFVQGAFHFFFAGTSGSGKTMAIRRFAAALEQFKKNTGRPLSIIILDYKGYSFLDFPQLLGSHWRHFDVHGDLRLGLQPPAGVPAGIWINHLATSFCGRTGLKAAWVTFANLLRWLAAVMNPRPSNRLQFPDFQLLLDVQRALPSKTFSEKSPYTEAQIQYVEGVVQASGELFRCFEGLDLERDLISQGQSAVISMPNLSPAWLNHFIADLLVLQLLLGRTTQRLRAEYPEVILILDDCDEAVSRQNERLFHTSLPPMVRGLRQIREMGVGIAIGTGALAPVSDSILNSVRHFFVFQNPFDTGSHAPERILGLPPGNQTLIESLVPGECIVRLPGAWPHGVLAQIDPFPLNAGGEPSFDSNRHVPARRLNDWPELQEAVSKLGGEHRATHARQAHGRLRSQARELLYLACSHPYWPVARLYDLMAKPSPAIQKAIRNELHENKYAAFVEVRLGKRNLLLIEPLDAAWTLLGKSQIKLVGRGELEHRTYQAWLDMVGTRRGHSTNREWTVPGTTHSCDVAWHQDGRTDAFEIVVTCSANLESHVNATLLSENSPVTSLTIVAPRKNELASLRKQVAQFIAKHQLVDCVHFESIESFANELWP